MQPAELFPERLAAPDCGDIGGVKVAVVVAHPDDESIGIGAQLRRMRDVLVVVVTDGAPRDEADARALGFLGWRDYRLARQRELEAALAEAGVTADCIVRLDKADKSAVLALAGIARALAEIFGEWRIEVAITHPYEGGHPDHDAVAFAVRAAASLLRQSGAAAPLIIEMTSYYPTCSGMVRQKFAPGSGGREAVVALAPEALALKRRMFAAHRSQAAQLAQFTATDERFRPAPDYDFSVPANGGAVNYHQLIPELTGEGWCRLALDSLTELDLR